MIVKQIKVGIADYDIAKAPSKIMTIGLGSCIGVSLYDSKLKMVGLAHIMLADSTKFKKIENKAKYANLAIPLLIKEMVKNGANKKNIKAKIVGGASMFNFSDSRMVSDIGKRNGIAVKECLKKEGIQIVAEDIGGSKGRTMIVDTIDGSVTLRIVGQGVKVL